jgi:transposase
MKAVVERCAGIDVGKTVLNVCVMTGQADQDPAVELREFVAFNDDLERLRQWLIETGCIHVGMESTGSYWKPVYAALEDSGVTVILANGEDVKGRRGHKTDWNDCQFLAHLVATWNDSREFHSATGDSRFARSDPAAQPVAERCKQ